MKTIISSLSTQVHENNIVSRVIGADGGREGGVLAWLDISNSANYSHGISPMTTFVLRSENSIHYYEGRKAPFLMDLVDA